MRFDGKSTGLFDEDAQSGSIYTPSETFETDSVEEQIDMVGDGEDDLEHGTFGHEEFELNLDDLEDLDDEEI